VEWYWDPAYRADGGLAAILTARGWRLRLEGGVGLVLNSPDQCRLWRSNVQFQGSCDAPAFPQPYRFSVPPGRVAPYLAIGVGRDVSWRSDDGAPGAAPAPASARDEDPRIDRAVVAPTALTQPARTATVTLYELTLLHLTVGLTDRIQVGAGIGVDHFGQNQTLMSLELKTRLLDHGRFHLAMLAEFLGVFGGHGGGKLARAGGVASVCLDDRCASVLSAAVFAMGSSANVEGRDHNEIFPLVTPSAVISLARHLRLVGELDLAPDGALWVVAARVLYAGFAVDVGAAQGPLGLLPVGSLSVRF